jgi:uncharacterized protein (UPF0371 family)
MGVNMIETGILNEELIAEACRQEIGRRVVRYTTEWQNGQEGKDTITRTRAYFETMG